MTKSSRPKRKMTQLKLTLILGSVTAIVGGANILAGADWVGATTDLPLVEPLEIAIPALKLEPLPQMLGRDDGQAMQARLARGQAALTRQLDEIPTPYAPDIPEMKVVSVVAAPSTTGNVAQSGTALPSVVVPSLPGRSSGSTASFSVELPPISKAFVPQPIVVTKSSK